jgi:4-hydroxy-tetrahydrodipicolinate synthase
MAEHLLSRRDCLLALAATVAASRGRSASAATPSIAKPMRGAFMILNTPFTTDGQVDWEDLGREAAFVDRCGAQGIVWPQGSSGVTTLTKDERMRGMDVLATAARDARVTLVLGVQGKDTAEMLEYTKRADALGTDAMIAMPPTTGTSMEDYRAYFRALAQATRRPVIIQTSGGAKNLVPSTDLIVEMAREFPHAAYVKEESEPLFPRMKAEIAQRPAMKGVFCANLGVNWLYAMRLGVDGVITGNGMYADLMARLWEFHEKGRTDELRDAYGRFLLLRNLNEQIPGADRYILKKRGVFKTTVTRVGAPVAGAPPRITDLRLSPQDIEEIEYRFAALRGLLIDAG